MPACCRAAKRSGTRSQGCTSGFERPCQYTESHHTRNSAIALPSIVAPPGKCAHQQGLTADTTPHLLLLRFRHVACHWERLALGWAIELDGELRDARLVCQDVAHNPAAVGHSISMSPSRPACRPVHDSVPDPEEQQVQHSLPGFNGRSSGDTARTAKGSDADDSSSGQPSARQHGQRSLVKLRHGWRVFPQVSLLLWILIVDIVPYPHKFLRQPTVSCPPLTTLEAKTDAWLCKKVRRDVSEAVLQIDEGAGELRAAR